MANAVRMIDMHTCPQVTGTVPHAGGIFAGASTVLINNMPAMKQGDIAICVGPPNSIATGSGTVFIENKPAARMGDTTAHGGSILTGSPNVLIGG